MWPPEPAWGDKWGAPDFSQSVWSVPAAWPELGAASQEEEL